MARRGNGGSEHSGAIKAMSQYLKRRVASWARIENDALVQRLRRARVVDRNRERLTKAAYGKLGMEARQVESLHAREQQALARLGERQKKRVHDYAAERARENRLGAQRLVKYLNDLPDPALEPSKVFLLTADAVEGEFLGPTVVAGNPLAKWVNVHTHSGQPGRNYATGYGIINAAKKESAVLQALLRFHFVWQSTRAGLLTATSPLYADVMYYMGTHSTCAGMQAYSHIVLKAFLTVGQHQPGKPIATATGPISLLLDQARETTGFADPTVGPLLGRPIVGESLTQGAAPLPIVAGSPVVVTVTAYAVVAVQTGFAQFDFDDPLEFSVPVVWLDIQ